MPRARSREREPVGITSTASMVVDSGDGETEGNTVNVRTDLATIEEIESGNLTALEAFDQDRIIIEGEGFFSWIKFAIMNFFYDLGLM